MKQSKMIKKLSLNKKTVAHIGNVEMRKVKGAGTVLCCTDEQYCSDICPDTSPGSGSTDCCC